MSKFQLVKGVLGGAKHTFYQHVYFFVNFPQKIFYVFLRTIDMSAGWCSNHATAVVGEIG